MAAHDRGPVRVELDGEGVMHLRGRLGDQCPVCPQCGQPIRLALDVTSFSIGIDHVLVHAHCLWRPEVFVEVGRRAAEVVAEEEQAPRRATG